MAKDVREPKLSAKILISGIIFSIVLGEVKPNKAFVLLRFPIK